MFRIVQFKIPEHRVEQWIEQEKGAFRYFTEVLTGLDKRGEFYYSEPMSTTSAKFFMCEQYLRSLVGDPPEFVRDMTDEYRLLRTRAPQSYDYGYVIEIGKMPGEFGEERLVCIPKTYVDYQSGRYASGMYTPIVCS